MNNKKKIILSGFLLVALFVVIGVSYAVWQMTLIQTDKNIVTTGCLKIEFSDANPITIDKAYPMTDEEGKNLTPYEFTLTNTCDSEANYYINLETVTSSEKKLSEQYLRASLKKGEEEVFLNNLNSSYINLDKVIAEASNAYKLYQGVLKESEVLTFNLNLWMDNETEPLDEVMNATYEGKITVSTSYKAPKETDNMMIPMEFESFRDPVDGWVEINRTYCQGYNYGTLLNRVVFQDTLMPYENAVEVVDFSVAQDKSVLGYYVKNESNEDGYTSYTLYIQADGKIKVNYDGSYYFFINTTSSGTYNYSYFEGLENLDTSLVTDMSYMFYYNLNETLDLSTLDTSKVTNMSYMFSNMSNLTSLDLTPLDTSKVTNMSYMFDHMYNITSLDLSSFDTSNVTNMSNMFYYSSKLETISYGNSFIHKESATTNNMYTSCPANKPTHESWNGVF